ncbi:uncharacterized protein N7479_000275 [Penicillium vulpinum]|uniref:uncharacterized protein n=1 Tax=Penicillium vulpinum TaxID=29845 RepID=UPI0025480DD4|nr:uncharacterized protein N7479_000275 [Penicillium vulpinum]KAJ5970357.1 hypothetical protein N7479_000275 [Penicillium vulpinum]
MGDLDFHIPPYQNFSKLRYLVFPSLVSYDQNHVLIGYRVSVPSPEGRRPPSTNENIEGNTDQGTTSSSSKPQANDELGRLCVPPDARRGLREDSLTVLRVGPTPKKQHKMENNNWPLQ